MHKLINILAVTVFALQISCKAQSNNTVYLYFEDQKEVDCFRDESDKKSNETVINYKGKMFKHSLGEKIFFNICLERFLLINDTKIEKIKSNTVNKLKTVNFDYFIKRLKESDMFSKRYVFNKIYFIEKIDENEYLKYEVYWFDAEN
ncbi:hypothetical protein [Flavobacterium sp. HNIBRBA15423]|uniref:hypothetical protein n=1 Tax=Flavobacterium sp. HNIBRBA15423 TaxID=3458683 RepID=UPI0040449667